MEFDPGVSPDSIEWFQAEDGEPTIVSISDIHGYLDQARSALTAVGETDEYAPVVTTDGDGLLHWAGNDYVLVFNGDLIDRGPDNEECLELLARLSSEASPGRVRYHLGNHEMAVLFPDRFPWPGVFSIELPPDRRRSFIETVAAGHVPAAFRGYDYTYSHAGSATEFDVAAANQEATDAAIDCLEAMGAGTFDRQQQESIIERYPTVFGIGGRGGRGPDAGLLWMDFQHMPGDAPPQIVGHSRHREPTRKGTSVCQNVIRRNKDSRGGEAVLLERPGELNAVVRTRNDVSVRAV
ncbi:metallophosphoesterase [Halobaculum sp. EA56]|uniref:metallophosphoesterase n=1 Tax=Halobaculum sp. EA56 TaxID=3421648 RepID=UPI003EC148C1